MEVVKCPICGGSIEVDESSMFTKCKWCDSQIKTEPFMIRERQRMELEVEKAERLSNVELNKEEKKQNLKQKDDWRSLFMVFVILIVFMILMKLNTIIF